MNSCTRVPRFESRQKRERKQETREDEMFKFKTFKFQEVQMNFRRNFREGKKLKILTKQIRKLKTKLQLKIYIFLFYLVKVTINTSVVQLAAQTVECSSQEMTFRSIIWTSFSFQDLPHYLSKEIGQRFYTQRSANPSYDFQTVRARIWRYMYIVWPSLISIVNCSRISLVPKWFRGKIGKTLE